jgi:hypothetical protein
MSFHIITLKKQKCQDVKMPRLQGYWARFSHWDRFELLQPHTQAPVPTTIRLFPKIFAKSSPSCCDRVGICDKGGISRSPMKWEKMHFFQI